MRKRIGPRTDPWGTPEVTGAGADDLPSTTTCWVLLFRKTWIHDNVWPLTPYLLSLYANLVRYFVESFAEIQDNSVSLDTFICLGVKVLHEF